MKSCCAVGCANRYSKGVEIHFYRFPSDEQKIALWVARMMVMLILGTRAGVIHSVVELRAKELLCRDYSVVIYSYSLTHSLTHCSLHSYTELSDSQFEAAISSET